MELKREPEGLGSSWLDPRVERGMATQLAAREDLLLAGAEHLGWKLGFGSAAARKRWEIPGPAVGFLTSRSRLRDSAPCDVAGWAAPRLEPEIAVIVSRVDGDPAEPGQIALAIELADLGPADADLAAVVGGDLCHRAFLVGEPQPISSYDGLEVSLTRDGEEIGREDALAAAVGGTPFELTAFVASYLERFGQRLEDGDIILTGSVLPLVDLVDGGTYTATASQLSPISVEIGPN